MKFIKLSLNIQIHIWNYKFFWIDTIIFESILPNCDTLIYKSENSDGIDLLKVLDVSGYANYEKGQTLTNLNLSSHVGCEIFQRLEYWNKFTFFKFNYWILL